MLAGNRNASHMLSFDVEEYFQVEAAAIGGVGPEQWDSFQKRLAPCVDRILQLLSDYGASATFFILGWVVDRERDVVRRIAGAGPEIASHGMSHSMRHRLTPERLQWEYEQSLTAKTEKRAHHSLGSFRVSADEMDRFGYQQPRRTFDKAQKGPARLSAA